MKQKLLIILILSLFICGCQSEKEINNLSIVNAIGIDINDDKYDVTIQILETNKSYDNNEEDSLNKMITYTSSGKSISEALNSLTLKSPKSLYLGHLELVVIGEELAESGITKIMDYFLRNSNVSKNFTILTTKDTNAKNILSILKSDESFPTGNILGSVEISSVMQGTSNNIKFINFMNDLLSEGKNPILPSIKMTDEDKLIIDNIGVFKGDKLIGYLDSYENIAYNFITDNIKSTNISYKCDDENYIGIGVTKSNTDIKSIIKNNKPVINLNILINAKINEVNCSNGLDNIDTVREKTEAKVKNMVDDIITKTKEDIQSDIFGFGEKYYQNHLTYWKKIKNNWDNEYYPNIEVNTNVEVRLDNQGSILGTAR